MNLKPLVLIIDDQESVLSSLEILLKDDYIVTPISTMQQAIEFCKGIMPDAVLLDLNLGTIQGTDSFESISKVLGPHTPILIVTGNNDVPEYVKERAASIFYKGQDAVKLQTDLKMGLAISEVNKMYFAIKDKLEEVIQIRNNIKIEKSSSN